MVAIAESFDPSLNVYKPLCGPRLIVPTSFYKEAFIVMTQQEDQSKAEKSVLSCQKNAVGVHVRADPPLFDVESQDGAFIRY